MLGNFHVTQRVADVKESCHSALKIAARHKYIVGVVRGEGKNTAAGVK
jgi:hypothetical protein